MTNGTISLPTHNRLDNVPSDPASVSSGAADGLGTVSGECGVFHMIWSKLLNQDERTGRPLIYSTVAITVALIAFLRSVAADATGNKRRSQGHSRGRSWTSTALTCEFLFSQ